MNNRLKWLIYVTLSLILFFLLVTVALKNQSEIRVPRADPDRPKNLGGGEKLTNNLNGNSYFQARAKENEEGLTKALSTPIDFFGIVLDQHNQPVSNADIVYSIVSTLDFSNPKQQEAGNTGPDGRFSILGKNGASIYVKASHPDYLFTPSAQKSFSFFLNPNEIQKSELPTLSQPAIFRLIKKGETEPLLKQKQVLRNIPKNGQPMSASISGQSGAGITIRAWTSPRAPGASNNTPFAWKVRVEVPGGGLAAYENPYQFEAPVEGYERFMEFEMPAEGIDGKWRDRFDGSFFLKLADGNFARMRFQMIAGGQHFAVVESYYNPASGSRNLEFDPAKAIKPQ